MKYTLTVLLGLAASLGATTVSLTGPADFLFTDNAGTPLSFRNVQVGTVTEGIFVQFAVGDTSQPSIGLPSNAPIFAGRFAGNASDNFATADPFNNQPIVIRVPGENGAIGFLSAEGINFPVNNSGVGDVLSFSSESIDTVSPLSTDGVFIDTANRRIVVDAIPEPSVTLLGGLALFGGLVRRRR